MLRRLYQTIVRTSAFVRKEIIDVLRQPRLLLTLVLGPFLILLLFGIGYRQEARPLRTLFVVHADSDLAAQIDEYAPTLGPQLVYHGVTTDAVGALQQLGRGEVDVVVATPDDALERIRASEQAVFVLYHREINPFQVDYVDYFGQIYIDEVNRRVLLEIMLEGQADAATVQEELAEARANAARLREALEAGEQFAIRQHQANLARNLDIVSLALGASLGLISGVETTLGEEDESDAGDLLAMLAALRQDTEAINSNNANHPIGGGSNSQEVTEIARIEGELAILEERLAEFTQIDTNVLVRPFRSETRGIAEIQPTPEDYFAPAVIALLLQHLAITFAALSIVRERSVGTMELFRVSPLSAGETLFGKYLSYFIFGGILTAILTLLLVYVLRVPMLGDWFNYMLVVAAILFTSLGIGFVISILSKTDSQAVQFTMLVLLTSVFFSGFLMELSMIWEPVRVVSWALPTTYGIILLRDIFLRGNPADLFLLGGLFLIGVGLCLVSWLLLRRLISNL